jgi:Sulfotransferase domain
MESAILREMPSLITSRAADRLRRSKLRIPVSGWRHRGLKPADVMLASYPRSGNTWTKFMLAELLIGSEVDFCSDEEVVPIVGRHLHARRSLPGGGRLVKTHEPYRATYKRAIYLVRDVRDVALSFRKLRSVEGFNEESFEDFLVRFARGDIAGFGSWQEHVTSWLTAAEHDSDILVIRYEELVDETTVKLEDMANFLGISASPERISAIVENNRPAKMRNRKTQYSGERMSVTVGGGTYHGWRTQYSKSELSLLESAMQAMRSAGYDVETRRVVSGGRVQGGD